MKVFLMYKDRDFDRQAPLPAWAEALMQDFDLDILLKAMSADDRFLYDISKSALFQSVMDEGNILYRQKVLDDSIQNEKTVRDIYTLADEAVEAKRKNWFGVFGAYPGSILYSAVRMLEAYLPMLEKLRAIAREKQSAFKSEGFTRFFAMIQDELSDEYVRTVSQYLKDLKFESGIMISAMLGEGNELTGHALRKPKSKDKNWIRRILGPKTPAYSFSIDPRDEPGTHALGELRDRGINFAADALAQSADHVESFFRILKSEIGFYIACLNLRRKLISMGETLCFPVPFAQGALTFEFSGLYNVCLSLFSGRKSVGNNVRANGKNLAIITGVNEGGKSTFLRSVGIAQLMMQAGMFVPAEQFSADIRSGIFTHYRRKEDRDMSSGKFDEELKRMNTIVDRIQPHSLIFFNESFASTNEREGSEIARQIVSALLESGAKVFFVTHLYTFAAQFSGKANTSTIMLRAERRQDGTRTFRIVKGAPSQRSHGEDLFYKVFGAEKEPGAE